LTSNGLTETTLTLKLGSVLVCRRRSHSSCVAPMRTVLKEELGLMWIEAVVVRFQETSPNLKYENSGYPAWSNIRSGVSELRSESAKTWRNKDNSVGFEVTEGLSSCRTPVVDVSAGYSIV